MIGDNHSEDSIFRQAVLDAVPLRLKERVETVLSSDPTPGQLRRRAAAVMQPEVDANPLSGEAPVLYGPHDPLAFRRDGVQYGVFRKLKQGGYSLESRLDLHRMVVEEARRAVFGFVTECYEADLRTVLILHGKGERSDTPARLKNCVAFWLKELETVQAYCSALPQHGGTGAVYLLLRKSERSRQRNAEIYRR